MTYMYVYIYIYIFHFAAFRGVRSSNYMQAPAAQQRVPQMASPRIDTVRKWHLLYRAICAPMPSGVYRGYNQQAQKPRHVSFRRLYTKRHLPFIHIYIYLFICRYIHTYASMYMCTSVGMVSSFLTDLCSVFYMMPFCSCSLLLTVILKGPGRC